jgi:hypothetical protein
MTPPVSENTHPKKTFDVSLALVQFVASSVKACKNKRQAAEVHDLLTKNITAHQY